MFIDLLTGDFESLNPIITMNDGEREIKSTSFYIDTDNIKTIMTSPEDIRVLHMNSYITIIKSDDNVDYAYVLAKIANKYSKELIISKTEK
jgi:hypothetical protein